MVGFGALNLDHLYAVPELIRDGGVEVITSTAQAGGSAANTVYGLAKLGLRCGFVGAVGDDEAGNTILESFREVGVDTGGIVVKPRSTTGHTVCITARQDQKAIYIVPGANSLLRSNDIDLAYLSDTRHVHISSFVHKSGFSQQVRAVEGLPPPVRVSLALDAVYARHGLKALRGLLGRCALAFANAEELCELAGRDLYSAAQACLDAGCGIVVATFGAGMREDEEPCASGIAEDTASIIMTRRKTGRGHETTEHTVPAIRTHDGEVADTIGAGDAFAAGFLFGLLCKRYGPAKSGALGHTAAGFCLTRLGARDGLPTREELLTRYEKSFRPLFERRGRTASVAGGVRPGRLA